LIFVALTISDNVKARSGKLAKKSMMSLLLEAASAGLDKDSYRLRPAVAYIDLLIAPFDIAIGIVLAPIRARLGVVQGEMPQQRVWGLRMCEWMKN
jgi:hypothetical protein